MKSLAAFVVAVCMVIVAASVGVALYAYLGIPGTEAAVIGIATLTGLALYNAVAVWLRTRRDRGGQIADLSRGTAELAGQVSALGRQLTALEQRVDAASGKTRAALSPLANEIGELGLLLKQLADTVAAHDVLLHHKDAAAAPLYEDAGLPQPEQPAGVPVVSAGDILPPEGRISGGAFAGLTKTEALAAVTEAVEANRVDLLLQPVVTLPQRKVRYYEGFARMRTAAGETAPAVDFVPLAEQGQVVGKLDAFMLQQCVQVLRRLQTKNRDLGLFCNMSAATLGDAPAFMQISEFLLANREFASSLILEFRQDAFNALGPIESDALTALIELGIRFSLDHVSDLRFDPKVLIARGVRHVKITEAVLSDPANAASADIHPSDLSDLLGRFGIELVIERIESEASVANLLDLDIRFGQGNVFAPPRAVRAETIQAEETIAPAAAVVAASSSMPMPPQQKQIALG